MAAILHRIKAYLYANPLTGRPDDYMAKVRSEKSVGIAEVCASAVSRGGADLPQSTIQHGVDIFLKEMAYLLCDGYSINTGYFVAGPLVKGIFNNPAESFDPARHHIQFRFKQGEALRKERSSIEVEILGLADNNRCISEVTDIRTGSANHLLSPGRNLKIKGCRIRVAGDHADAGIYFVNSDTDESMKVEPTDLVVNNPSELIVVIPDLAAGIYELRITTQFNKPGLLKDPRTIIFPKLLTVQ